MLLSLRARVAELSLKFSLTRAPLELAPKVSTVTLLASRLTSKGLMLPIPAYRPTERSPSVRTDTLFSSMLPPSSTTAP
ncbi:hypothetical protein FQZ97_1019550 [compost metagenome]